MFLCVGHHYFKWVICQYTYLCCERYLNSYNVIPSRMTVITHNNI